MPDVNQVHVGDTLYLHRKQNNLVQVSSCCNQQNRDLKQTLEAAR